jgi:cytochrome bd-type quinol oxidase subunit 2
VVSGVILWGAFPIVYSTVMSAFYLPVLLMLAGLILRGVAFEFRRKTEFRNADRRLGNPPEKYNAFSRAD